MSATKASTVKTGTTSERVPSGLKMSPQASTATPTAMSATSSLRLISPYFRFQSFQATKATTPPARAKASNSTRLNLCRDNPERKRKEGEG